MKVGEVLFGKSYGTMGGKLESMVADPGDIVTSAEDMARQQLVDKFVSTLPRPNVSFDHWWQPVAAFNIPGSKVTTFNASVIWLSTRVGEKGAINYPYYAVGLHEDEISPLLMLAPAEMGEDSRGSDGEIGKNMVILDMKNRNRRFYRYIEGKLAGNERLEELINPTDEYTYTPNSAYWQIGLTPHHYKRAQKVNGITENQWQDFRINDCLENLAANLGVEKPLKDLLS